MSKLAEYSIEVAKAAPPVGVLSVTMWGLTVPEWTALLAFILIVFQLVVLVRKEIYLPLKEKYGLRRK